MGVPTTWPVKYKCGHTEKRDLSRVPASRRREAANSTFWATKAGKDGDGLVCTKCFNEHREANKDQWRRQLLIDSEQFSTDHDLPELTGTEKQQQSGLVDSAQIDRFTVLSSIIDELNESEAETAIEAAKAITRAGWWTNNVGYTARKELELDATDLSELIVEEAENTDTAEYIDTENPHDWDGTDEG